MIKCCIDDIVGVVKGEGVKDEFYRGALVGFWCEVGFRCRFGVFFKVLRLFLGFFNFYKDFSKWSSSRGVSEGVFCV